MKDFNNVFSFIIIYLIPSLFNEGHVFRWCYDEVDFVWRRWFHLKIFSSEGFQWQLNAAQVFFSLKKKRKPLKNISTPFCPYKNLQLHKWISGCLRSPGLQGDVAVEHPAVVKLRLVSAWARVSPLAALAGLAPCRHGLPLQADLSVGCWAGTSAGVRRWGRRRQRAECELTAWTAGQLCTKTARREKVVK